MTAEEATAPEGSERADGDGHLEGDGPDTETRPLTSEAIRDALPQDLDSGGVTGPYMFPDNNRRRIPAVLYWAVSAACVTTWFLTRDSHPVLVNAGFLWAAAGLAVVGAYSFVAGWDLNIDERDALVVAVKQVGFPVGHASAQMGWRGMLSRPTWRILLYEAEDPPTQRGLVLVDGVDGSVVEWFVEANPENWDEL